MNVYTPSEYANEFFNGKITCRTVRNWIATGRMPVNTEIERTPTGRFLIHVDICMPESKVGQLVKLLEGGSI
ncbi:hypothetical protein K734_03405 [Idiomarina loihiensis GSL 199]|nr:hypothetical protein K734_03405 [Idiomarina loihiensis GSL 199]